jgi:ABC-2 type transport system permease protein
MRITPISAIVLRQFYLMRGSISRVLPLFIWVAVDIVLWGFMTKYLNTVASPGFDFVPVLLGAVLMWDFFTRVMHGVTMAFFEDVWSRNFLNIFASPMTIAEYLAGLVAASIATSAIGLLVMLVLATAVFGLSFLSYGGALVPFLLVLFLFGIALGIVGCALVLRLGPSAEWFVWPIPALLSPFAGVFYPIATLPGWMQLFARLLPPSYVFEGMRAIVMGGTLSWSALAISGVLAVIDVLVASMFFTRVYRHAVRTGLIARYSAESVS